MLFIVAPFLVWFLAFAAWFFWPEIKWLADMGKRSAPVKQVQKPAKEKIFEEDRKTLEEVLKKRK